MAQLRRAYRVGPRWSAWKLGVGGVRSVVHAMYPANTSNRLVKENNIYVGTSDGLIMHFVAEGQSSSRGQEVREASSKAAIAFPC
jgi:hypothetical protein